MPSASPFRPPRSRRSSSKRRAHGKHVFCEKPLAASSRSMPRTALAAVQHAGVVHGIDFIFPEIAAWRHARTLIAEDAIGQVAHFAYTWRVETYASRTNAETWKNRPLEGGGVLGNFVSHVFYNIEWLLGQNRRLRRHGLSAGTAGRGEPSTAWCDWRAGPSEACRSVHRRVPWQRPSARDLRREGHARPEQSHCRLRRRIPRAPGDARLRPPGLRIRRRRRRRLRSMAA